jgi:membrane protease YdiL (CAAX protease family)
VLSVGRGASVLQDGINEEVLVVGLLLTRLELLGFRPARAVAVSAVLRGSYHLQQGIGPLLATHVSWLP